MSTDVSFFILQFKYLLNYKFTTYNYTIKWIFFQRKTRIHKQSQQPQISPETPEAPETSETPDNNTENIDILKYSENSVELESHSDNFYLEFEEI